MTGFLERIESFTEIMAKDFQDRGYALKYAGNAITPEEVGSRRGVLPALLHHSAWLAVCLLDGADRPARNEISRWFGGIRLDDSDAGIVASDEGSPAETPISPLLLLNQESIMAAIRASPPMEIEFETILVPPKSAIRYFMEIIKHGQALHTKAKDPRSTADSADSPGGNRPRDPAGDNHAPGA